MYLGEGSNIALNGAIISWNAAINGSGIFVNRSAVSADPASNPTRVGAEFQANVASVAGGGVYLVGVSSAVRQMTIENSTATLGGGVFVAGSGSAVLEDLVIRSNRATNAGGGLAAENSQMTAVNVFVHDNDAANLGGGVYAVNSKLSGSLTSTANAAEVGAGAASVGKSEFNGVAMMENVATVAGGGLAATFGSLTLHHVSIELCRAPTGVGGGLFAENAKVVFDDVRIEACLALHGGGMYVNASMLSGYSQSGATTALQATLLENTASEYGGGVCLVGVGSSISDVYIDGATADAGGGLAAIQARQCAVSRSLIRNSSASSTGGGAYFGFSSDCTLRDSVLASNDAVQSGGGLAVIDSTLRHFNLTVADNVAGIGGGLYAASQTNTLTVEKLSTSGSTSSLIVSNEITSDDGGANAWLACTLSCKLEGMKFTGANLTQGNGGGLYVTGSGSATIADSTFQNNYAEQGGAIAVVESGSTTLANAAFLGNSAQYGGGLWSTSVTLVPSIEITDSVFYNNTAIENGGAVFLQHVSLSTDRVIVVENSAGDSTDGMGGGLFIGSEANATIESSLFTANAAFYGGSLAGVSASSMVIADSSIQGGTNAMGAAWSAKFKTVTGSTYSPWKAITTGDVSSKHGGLIYLIDEDTTAESRGSVFSDGSAEAGGGAYVSMYAYLQLEDTTFTANSASESGGSICLSGSAQAYIFDSSITSSSKWRMHQAEECGLATLT